LFQGVSRQEFGFKMLQSMGWSEGQARERREGCGGSVLALTQRRAGARRVGHGHHQAHRSRQATRPNRRVRPGAQAGGSVLMLARRAGIGADIARDSSAKIEWSVNMQNFDTILAGARPAAAQHAARSRAGAFLTTEHAHNGAQASKLLAPCTSRCVSVPHRRCAARREARAGSG
jgi:hypothetical protein